MSTSTYQRLGYQPIPDSVVASPPSPSPASASILISPPVVDSLSLPYFGLPTVLAHSILSCLSIKDLISASKTCHWLERVSGSDIVWRRLVLLSLGVHFLPSAGLRWREAYIRAVKPKLVPPCSVNGRDLQVVLTCVLNVADITTDIIMICGFAMQGEMTFLAIGAPWLVLAPSMLLLMERVKEGEWTDCRTMLATLCQLRCVLVAFKYFQLRRKRAKISGKRAGQHQATLHSQDRSESVGFLDVAIVQLFAAVFESAPQALLQTYILLGLQSTNSLPIAITSIALSFASVGTAWAVVHIPAGEEGTASYVMSKLVILGFAVTGLAARLCAYAIYMAAMPHWALSIGPLVLSYLVNWIVIGFMGVERSFTGLSASPFFAAVCTVVPITIEPHYAGWRIFNLLLFLASQSFVCLCAYLALQNGTIFGHILIPDVKPEAAEYRGVKLSIFVSALVLHVAFFVFVLVRKLGVLGA